MTTRPAQPDAERVLVIAAGAFVAACLIVWTAARATGAMWSTPIGHTIWESPLLIWRLLTEPSQPHPHPDASTPAYYTVLTLLTVLTAGAVTGIHQLIPQRRRNDPEGGARWARPRDLKPLLVPKPQPGRLTLGTVHRRLVATEAQHSVAVIGPTGTGKTTGFAIPALLEWDGPVVCTSIRDDLLQATIAHRQTQGDVWVYDPTASTGQPVAGWNPLTTTTDWQGALRMAAWLVSTAKAGDKGGLQDSDFWYAVAQKLLAPLLLAAATSGHTMRDVVRWVDLQDDIEPLQALHLIDNQDAIQAFIATITREERTRSSAYTTTETVLAAFADPDVLTTTTAKPAITADRLLDGGSHTLYICGPLDDQARLRPLFTALIEEVIHAVYRRANQPSTRLRKPLLLAIDEAANIAPLPDLAQIASTARGVGIQLVTVWQDFAQLQARYDTFAQTVINNHRAKVILSGISDTSTLDYMSRLIGEERTTETSETKDHKGIVSSTTEAVRHHPLAPPALLRQSDIGTGVLVYGNLPPAQLRLRPSHRRPRLRRGAGKSATSADEEVDVSPMAQNVEQRVSMSRKVRT